ncbi:hypothetical protein [Streptacidiphilus sp. EB103A]|uniref:hypothetical protein n=1 Tax=Streptacidiphilus sp. EB103A TaxID=3156275 RepID=UPI003517DA91
MAAPDDGRRLWVSTDFGDATDPCNVQNGSASVLGVLTLADRLLPRENLRVGVAWVADWTSRHVSHGVAGSVLTQIHLWQATGRAELLERAELGATHCWRPPSTAMAGSTGPCPGGMIRIGARAAVGPVLAQPVAGTPVTVFHSAKRAFISWR